MTSVREILQEDEQRGLDKFKECIECLNMEKGPKDKLLSMFKSAFAPSCAADADIVWDYVQPLSNDIQIPYETLPEPENPKDLLEKLVVVKLNGGLGTTMGCTYPKSLIKVRGDDTFFDLVVDQVRHFNDKYGVSIPLVLMHSFYTDDLMKPHLDSVEGVKIHTFLQNKFPRIYEDTLEPVPNSPDSPLNMWNPPGHGDVFHSFRDSGLLDQFIEAGKRYMMVSNIDNLGSTIDLKILNKIRLEGAPFLAETVSKTLNDLKGGMQILYKGKVKLLETAQVPPGHMEDFCDMKFLDYFNANNMWVDLHRLKAALDQDKLRLDVIKNRKVLNGRNVIQLEAASGSAIQSFEESICVRVPRDRFLPVKSCNEFLLMRSDVYEMNGSFFSLNPKRKSREVPSVRLGPVYTHVSEFEKRFPYPIHMLNIEKLQVDGDITFGEDVYLNGEVIFKAPDGQKWVVPSGRSYSDVTITSEEQL